MESLVISVTVPSSDEDALVGFFYEAGSVGVEVQDFKSHQITLCAFFPSGVSESLGDILNRLAPQLSESSCQSLRTTWIPDEDWLKPWRDSLQPFRVGATFFVIPASNGVERDSGGRTKIRIEPGMAFGTGTHESTQLCLQALEQLEVNNRVVLDVGTGSGILAIAAIHRGARIALACDTDRTAVQVALSNFALNQVLGRTRTWNGSVEALRRHSVEICFANLTLNIFEGLWDEFERVLSSGGWLVSSGILQEQEDTFQTQLARHHFLTQRQETANGWVCVVARRESGS